MSYKSDGKVNKSDKDKNAAFQERFHAILDDLLKEEDNKYCVDCDAKGPRWASWNLGVFMCIRCAGIHRKMGVHIARVKSVNLDSWTAEQVAMMQEMGNSRGRAVYEANLSENFRRPQTDSGIEAFIFAKYVQKKYIAKEWVPPKPNVEFVLKEPSYVRDREHHQSAVLAEAKKKTHHHASSDAPHSQAAAAATSHVPPPNNNKTAEVQKPAIAPVKQPPATVDLISVDDLLSDGGDFGAFEGYTSDASSGIGSLASSDIASLQVPSAASQLNPSVPLQTQHNISSDLADLQPNVSNGQGQGQGQGASKKSKDDILKLYSGMTAAGSPAMMPPAGMYGGQVPGGVPMQMYAQHPMTGAAGGGMMPGAMMAPGYPGAMPYGANQQQMMMPNMQYPGHAQQVVPPSYASCIPGSAGNMQYQQQPQSGMQPLQQPHQPSMQQYQQPHQPGMQQFQQQPQPGMQQFHQQPGMQFQQPQQPGVPYLQSAQYQPYQQPQHINMNMMNQQMAGLSMNNSATQNTTGASNGHGWP